MNRGKRSQTIFISARHKKILVPFFFLAHVRLNVWQKAKLETLKELNLNGPSDFTGCQSSLFLFEEKNGIGSYTSFHS